MPKKLKILIIDDEPSITRVVSRLLTRNGYEAVSLNDPPRLRNTCSTLISAWSFPI